MTLYVRAYMHRDFDKALRCITVDSGVEKTKEIDFKAVIEFTKAQCVVPPFRILCLVPKESNV